MKLEESFKILGIDENASIEELNITFRKLAKKYHPDFNHDREEWANKKMTQINLAYEVALNYFTSPSRKSASKDFKDRIWIFNKYFNRAKNYILQGMLIYYQYGLENPHLRNEGVRRIRFNDSIRYVEKGIKSLKDIYSTITDEAQKESCKILLEFSTAFFRNMNSSTYFRPSGNAYEDEAYWHFHNGIVLLDEAIKEIFFGDLIINIPNRGNYISKLSRSYEEFVLVVSEYPKSSWVVDTILQIYLVELLTKLIKVFKEMNY